MGYVTAQQLEEKYGGYIEAAQAFLEEKMTDPDEREAVRQRLSPITVVIASHRIISARLDDIHLKLKGQLEEKGGGDFAF
jgi:hypothetical protein